MEKEIKKYEIEYRLHYNKYDFDVCSKVFEGHNKTDAIKNYNKKTGIPRSAIIDVVEVK